MGVVSVPLGRLSAVLRARAKREPAAIMAALKSAAHRARRVLVRVTPVDTGGMKNAWTVLVKGETIVAVENDHPAAGVMEKGARPHAVSPEGIALLTEWVRRKGLAGGKPRSARATAGYEAEVQAIVHAIIWKLRTKGQKGLYFVLGQMPTIRGMLPAEIGDALRKLHDKPVGGGNGA